MNSVLAAVLLASVAGEVTPVTGWETAGMTASRPVISYYENGQPRLVISCSRTQTRVQVRGFAAAQQWPQPRLAVRLGTVERAANPDLSMIGDQTAFSFHFPIADSVLAAMRSGAAISAEYVGQKRDFPVVPAALREEFADKCAALVPAGMRHGR